MYGLGVIVNGLVIVGASFAALILKKFIMKFDKNNKVEKIERENRRYYQKAKDR